MSETPRRRRLLDSVGGSPTFVSEGCQVTGDVETQGAIVVAGSVRGDGKIGSTLSMAAKARWEGEVRAKQAVIAGEIVGRLLVEEKLEIGASAIAEGAVVDGEVTVTSGQPVVRFEDKRG
jgi:cytoskeletal protein CcmA (bactofilin family)